MATSRKKNNAGPVRYRLSKPEHGGQDWLNIRYQDEEGRRRISASAAAAIYDRHPFVPADQYAAEMLSGIAPVPTEPTWAMTRGNDLEPLCIKWANDRLGVNYHTPEELFCYDDHDRAIRLISTLDGFWEAEHERKVLEIKTMNRQWSGQLPDYWRMQGIQQAICADVDLVTWAVFDSSLQLHIHQQPVTDDDKEGHLKAASQWLSAIDLGMTPSGVEWSFSTIQTRYPEPVDDDAVDVGDEYRELVEQLKHIKSELKSYQELEDQLKARICEVIGEHSALSVNGTVVATWKAQARSSFDSKSFKADHPELADKYQRTVTVRTLLLKGAK